MGPSPRCSACAAAVRPDAPWCTQCFTPLRAGAEAGAPPPPVAVLPLPRQAEDPDAPAPARPVAAPAPPQWPCTACGTQNPLASGACSACGSSFLAAASGRPRVVVPGVGDVLALSRAQRLGLALLVLAVVLLVTAVLTGALTPEPAPTLPDVAG